MTDPTENATLPKSTKSRNPNSSVQIQIKLKSQFEFGPRDPKKFEFFDLIDFGDVAISVGTVILCHTVNPLSIAHPIEWNKTNNSFVPKDFSKVAG